MAHKLSLAYLWLKIRVTIVRLTVRIMISFIMRRDRALVSSMPITKTQLHIPSRDTNRTILADLYSPSTHALDSKTPTPVLLNWHGSGFFVSLHGIDALFCATVAQETSMLVLDLGYRKAPEHPYPAAVEDVEDALLWVAAQPKRFDLAKVAVSGFSAGANLALVAATHLRSKLADTIQIPIVLALYPWTDLSIAPDKRVIPKPVRAISPAQISMMTDCYLPDKSLCTDPKVSPGLAPVEAFPETVVVVTCEGDTLGPEGVDLGKRLKEAGRKVVSFEARELHHGWDKGCKEGSRDEKEREAAYAVCVEALKESLL
jgi:acetyl esterase/lipase